MKDYMTLYARVKSVKLTLENIKTGKIKIEEPDCLDSLWDTELEIVNPDETQIVKDRMTQHKLSILKKITRFFNKIGMPLIGCGLDRLKWDKVSEIIKDVFADTDIEIVVCRR